MSTLDQIFQRVRRALQDPDKRQWKDAELIDGTNDAHAALLKHKPRIFEVTEVVTLAAGHRQVLPNDADVLFNCIENVSHQSARAITVMSRASLDRARPGWRSEAGSPWVAHYAYVETEVSKYDVYPPAKAGTTILISYAKPPKHFVENDAFAGVYVFPAAVARFEDAIVDYLIYHLRMKERDSTPHMEALAMAHYQSFLGKIGVETASRAKASPNTTSPGGRPSSGTN